MYASITSLPVALFLALFVRSANSFISLLAESRESAFTSFPSNKDMLLNNKIERMQQADC